MATETVAQEVTNIVDIAAISFVDLVPDPLRTFEENQPRASETMFVLNQSSGREEDFLIRNWSASGGLAPNECI